jgi:hypothetical protein
MKTFVVITSIFEPTVAVKTFAKNIDFRVIVVGDKKSPVKYECAQVDFLSWVQQEELGYKLTKVLPYNHYCRKMIGYLHAIKNGAEIIIDTDDDNIPKSNFVVPEFAGDFKTIVNTQGFVNVYEIYTDKKVWPRGLPLRLINSKTIDFDNIKATYSNVGIWQGLADEDPDVDAIYRLTNGNMITFSAYGNVVLDEGSISPFNSQNTIIRKDLFPLLYLPSKVTFRFTDILRGFVAQPIMWAAGYRLGFTDATVVQERNPHDFTKDFESEIPMYIYTDKVIDLCTKVVSSSKSIVDNLYDSYVELEKAGIVASDELKTLSAWLSDLQLEDVE